MKKRTALAALLLALLLPAFARAETDENYNGRIDPVTGSPYGQESGAASGGRSRLSDTMYFDFSTHDYVYPLPSGQGELHASVADGMITGAEVRLTVPEDSAVTVYRDGEPYEGSLTAITARGGYVVREGTDLGAQQVLSFRVIGPVTNGMEYFTVPDGFYLSSVRFGAEGEEADYPTEDRYTAALQDEGRYVIEYVCTAADMTCILETVIDRTPPALAFEGTMDRNGGYRSAVTFTGLQRGDTMAVTLNGTPLESLHFDETGTGGVLEEAGSYMVEVYDSAGNRAEYALTILPYLNLKSWVFVALVAAAFCGTAAYIIVKRRRLKFC